PSARCHVQDPTPPDIYTLSLHDALPICTPSPRPSWRSSFARSDRSLGAFHVTTARTRALVLAATCTATKPPMLEPSRPKSPVSRDRKSTRLNSSHLVISYAVFCLKKKKK